MKNYYFFIGTEAELIKMTAVIKFFQEKKVPFKIISSGQNDLSKSVMLKYLHIKAVDINLTKKQVSQTPYGLISWFLKTTFRGLFVLGKEFRQLDKAKTWMIIHGDTVSTLMGAIIGRVYGLKIGHVEAGYKSSRLFYPFPEELDRTLSSYLSDVLFCPYTSIGHNALRINKKKVNTFYNTSIDSLHIAMKIAPKSKLIRNLRNKKYFIFALHRQEALLNKKLVIKLINFLFNLKTDLYCVFALHNPTKRLLNDLKLLNRIKRNKKIVVIDRIPYIEYINVLTKSEFIMTDGVGNQQETYYLGKPCLILRNLTEGFEGLNNNAVLSFNNPLIINKFAKNYKRYQKPYIIPDKSPSVIIGQFLLK